MAAIGHVLADGEVGFVGVNVAGVAGEVAGSGQGYLRASLYFPALKFE